VTGAANGLGRTVAEQLAREGAAVACADLQLGPVEPLGRELLVAAPVSVPRDYGGTLSEVVAGIRGAGGNAVGIQCDIADERSCDELLWNVRRLLGPPDVLVNVAVLSYFVPALEFPTDWVERMFAVNVVAVFTLCRKVLPAMIARGSGAIVNVTSEAAVGPGRGPYPPAPQSRTRLGPPTVYGATKAAVERLTQGLAEEVYPHGIAVSAIAPANTVLDTPGARYLQISHRESEPAEHIAQAIALLASEPPQAVSGRVVYSQALLAEYGLLERPRGVGSDSPGTGYSAS